MIFLPFSLVFVVVIIVRFFSGDGIAIQRDIVLLGLYICRR